MVYSGAKGLEVANSVARSKMAFGRKLKPRVLYISLKRANFWAWTLGTKLDWFFSSS